MAQRTAQKKLKQKCRLCGTNYVAKVRMTAFGATSDIICPHCGNAALDWEADVPEELLRKVGIF